MYKITCLSALINATVIEVQTATPKLMCIMISWARSTPLLGLPVHCTGNVVFPASSTNGVLRTLPCFCDV